jgi:hypothetical protein
VYTIGTVVELAIFIFGYKHLSSSSLDMMTGVVIIIPRSQRHKTYLKSIEMIMYVEIK